MPKTKVKPPIAQWYVVNTFSGNERNFVSDIKNKVSAYGMGGHVQDVRMVTESVKEETEIKPANAPKKLNSTKTQTTSTSWQVLPNGNYKKIVVREKNKYAGYVFIKMIMDDATWLLIRNTPGVTGFIGSSGKGTRPFPTRPDEMLGVLGFELGEQVKIISEGGQNQQGVLLLDDKTGDPFVELPNGKKIPVNFYEIEKIVPEVVIPEPGSPKGAVVQRVERAKAHFEVGNTVTIKSQQLKGVVASINANKETASINVDMFGRPVPVEAGFADIEVEK